MQIAKTSGKAHTVIEHGRQPHKQSNSEYVSHSFRLIWQRMCCATLYSMSCSLCLVCRVCILVDLNLSTTSSAWVRCKLNKHRYWWDAQHGCQASCRMKCEQGVGMLWQPAVTFFTSASLVSYAEDCQLLRVCPCITCQYLKNINNKAHAQLILQCQHCVHCSCSAA